MMRAGASKGKEKSTEEEKDRKREKRSRQKVRIQEVKHRDQQKEKEEAIKEGEWEQERQKEREASIEDRQRKIRKRDMNSPLEPRQGNAEGNSHSNQACEPLGEEGARLAQKREICRDDEQGARKEKGKIKGGGAPQLSIGAVPRKVAECLGKWAISARRGDFQRAGQRGNRSIVWDEGGIMRNAGSSWASWRIQREEPPEAVSAAGLRVVSMFEEEDEKVTKEEIEELGKGEGPFAVLVKTEQLQEIQNITEDPQQIQNMAELCYIHVLWPFRVQGQITSALGTWVC